MDSNDLQTTKEALIRGAVQLAVGITIAYVSPLIAEKMLIRRRRKQKQSSTTLALVKQ